MSSKIIDIPCDAEVRNELSSMVYDRWSRACDNLKNVKNLTWEGVDKFCPKNDWPQHHKIMLSNAEKELKIATTLKDAICKYSPIVSGE